MDLVRDHGEFYTGGGLKKNFQIIKFNCHHNLFCTLHLKVYTPYNYVKNFE